MKKKLLFLFMLVLSHDSLFAQTGSSSRSEINSMLSSWLIPVIGLGLLLGFVALVWNNIDAIRGKNGLSKQDGWMAVGEGMIFVILGIGAIGFVAHKIASMNFTV